MVARMVTTLLALTLTMSPIFSNAQDFKTKDGKPDLSINSMSHDFGKIPQGQPASHSFTVKNTGDAPLVIKDVEPSCGCTTPKWPKKPIAPGDSAEIKAVYDAKSMGAFQKSIQVKTNVPFSGTKTLKIKGVVQKSDQKG